MTSASKAPQTLNVGRELADTTWRMTLPVVLFAGLGIAGDKAWSLKPWLTLAGMAVGFVFAGLLVKRQLNRWPAKLPKPGSYKRHNPNADQEDEKDYYND